MVYGVLQLHRAMYIKYRYVCTSLYVVRRTPDVATTTTRDIDRCTFVEYDADTLVYTLFATA